MRPLSTAVARTGNASRVCRRCIARRIPKDVDGAELAAVCDVDRSKAETMAQETGVPVFIEYEAMVQR
jgi:predicted dehydrogenase